MPSFSPSLRRANGGSLYVEMLFVILPFMGLVLGLSQTALMYTGSLAVQRSASVAARAAIVVLDDKGGGRGSYSGGRKADIERAASFPLYAIEVTPIAANTSIEQAISAWSQNPIASGSSPGKAPGLTVQVTGANRRGAPIRAYVKYDFRCIIPFARTFMCNGGKVTLEAQSTLPNHAANYKYGSWM